MPASRRSTHLQMSRFFLNHLPQMRLRQTVVDTSRHVSRSSSCGSGKNRRCVFEHVRRSHLGLIFVVTLILGPFRELRAQSLLASIGDVLTESILPGGYNAGLELRKILRTDVWKTYRRKVADTTAMNAIYELAFLKSGGDRTHALFASAIAVLEHRTIPIKLTYGLTLKLPLTLESEINFGRRTDNLPEHIYSESVADRDKLQHFFFSAYFGRILGMNWATNTLGTLVEMGEDLFVIGGVSDPRDMHANADGVRFAKQPIGALPSQSLTPNP
jgi:hypothetical protein